MSKISKKSAVVILSGGLDSSGVAAYWKRKDYLLYFLTFNYGQRATREIMRAKEIGKKLNAEDHRLIDISFMKELYGKTNVLTDSTKKIPRSFQSNIVVPIRNAIFLTIATAYAFSLKATVVAYGAHLTDRPYPDCRPEFAKELADTLNLGDIDAIMSRSHPQIKIWSPAIQNLSKAQMLKISFSILNRTMYRTWSCYLNGKEHCGRCESCINRRKAFILAGIDDLTDYAV